MWVRFTAVTMPRGFSLSGYQQQGGWQVIYTHFGKRATNNLGKYFLFRHGPSDTQDTR